MKTLTTLFATLVLLVTVGLRSVSTDFALNEANDEPAMVQTVASADGGSDGDGEEPSPDGNLSDI